MDRIFNRCAGAPRMRPPTITRPWVKSRSSNGSSTSANRPAAATRALFVASTTGEGDPPDGAVRFVREVMVQAPTLSLHYGLLALGDRSYSQFCAWGRALDGWLRQQGATALFERIEVSNADPLALQAWRARIADLSGQAIALWQEPEFDVWTLAERRELNAGSLGAPCFHIAFTPPPGAQWRAGDVLTVQLPLQPPQERDYSLASLPAEGKASLLIRQTRRPDGSLGVGSAWLTTQAEPGGTVRARLRSNVGFHAPDDARPMILIGNGTGIAGLRSLLVERIAARRHDNWLIFGERQATVDFHYRDELLNWQAQAQLAMLDLAFSRDGSGPRYVQDALRAQSERLREWIARGARVYVCGSAQGMATGVHEALIDILGASTVERLRDEERYRRDVY